VTVSLLTSDFHSPASEMTSGHDSQNYATLPEQGDMERVGSGSTIDSPFGSNLATPTEEHDPPVFALLSPEDKRWKQDSEGVLDVTPKSATKQSIVSLLDVRFFALSSLLSTEHAVGRTVQGDFGVVDAAH